VDAALIGAGEQGVRSGLAGASSTCSRYSPNWKPSGSTSTSTGRAWIRPPRAAGRSFR
jgi:hypothetical protein